MATTTAGEQSYGAYGYTYNPDNGGSWTYCGSGLVGMHYSELVNVGFYIDVDTATVVSTFTSTKDAAGGYASSSARPSAGAIRITPSWQPETGHQL